MRGGPPKERDSRAAAPGGTMAFKEY